MYGTPSSQEWADGRADRNNCSLQYLLHVRHVCLIASAIMDPCIERVDRRNNKIIDSSPYIMRDAATHQEEEEVEETAQMFLPFFLNPYM